MVGARREDGVLVDLAEFGSVLLRRWYIVMIGVVATAFMVAAATLVVPARYQAEASVLLYRPLSALGADGNPLVSLGGLESARDSLLDVLNAPDMTSKLGGSSDTELTIAADQFSSAPAITLTVVGESAVDALRVQGRAVEQIPISLREIQSGLGVDERAQVAALVLASSAEPERISKQQVRAGIAAAALGLVLTIAVVFALDMWQRRREYSPGSWTGIADSDSVPEHAS